MLCACGILLVDNQILANLAPPPPRISIYNIDVGILHADVLSIGKSLCVKQAPELPEEVAHTLGGHYGLAELSINDRARSKKKGESKESGSGLPLTQNESSRVGNSLDVARPSIASYVTINLNRSSLQINSRYPISELDDIVIYKEGSIDIIGDYGSVFKHINRITIDGLGVIYWGGDSDFFNEIYLNDLVISNGGRLKMAAWYNRYDSFLVRKNSKGLADALPKIVFDGGLAGVREYDKDYWEIGTGAGYHKLPVPEPTTYGAAFSLSALGFVAWRRRRSRSLATL